MLINCQGAYFIDMGIGSGEVGRCRKGIFERWRAGVPFQHPLEAIAISLCGFTNSGSGQKENDMVKYYLISFLQRGYDDNDHTSLSALSK